MKYMLIMNTPRDGYTQYTSWPKKILEANMVFMWTFTQKLRTAGELVSTVGLASPLEAKRVRSGKDGKPITDGVFPESKEFLAGYWIVDVDSPERAYQIAAEASTAPGAPVKAADGTPIDHLWVEVREIASCPPEQAPYHHRPGCREPVAGSDSAMQAHPSRAATLNPGANP